MPVEQVRIAILLDELEPHLGFRFAGAAGQRMRRESAALLALIGEKDLLAGRVAHEAVPVARGSRAGIAVDGAPAFAAPALAREFRRASHLVAAACTLGPAISEEIAALGRAGRRVAAVLLDSIAALALLRLAGGMEAAARRAAAGLGVAASGRFNPGDGALDLADQPAVLALAGAGRIGIALSSGQMMTPRFSLSAVFGLGRGMDRVRGCAGCATCAARERCPYGQVFAAGRKGARDDASCAA